MTKAQNTPPLKIWLQNGCSDDLGETWTTTKVYSGDAEYVIADEIRRALRGHTDSELLGENGLIAATMRCVDAVDRIEELLISGESDEKTLAGIREIFSPAKIF